MNYANTVSRNGKTTDKKKSAPTASAVGRLRKMDKKNKGCRASTQGQEPIRTTDDVANAFLKMRFPPRLQEIEIPKDADKLKMERDFYSSLSLIAEKFELSLKDWRSIPFPYNISESLTELRGQLKKTVTDWKEVRLIHYDNSTYFAKEECYNTGMTLYYIPIIPLYTILHRKETAKISKLLLSVYAYLYQILCIPYYRNDDCYLYNIYEMLEEWYSEDEPSEGDLTEFADAEIIGDYMKEKISDPKNLRTFGQRLKTFKPANDFENRCLIIVAEFYDLFKNNPKIRIDRKYYPLRFREEPDHTERTVMLDDYVSFCSSLKGNLFDLLFQYVNEDLQEYGEIDEPVRFIPYDGREISENNFEFEKRVFDGINNLIQLWQESIY